MKMCAFELDGKEFVEAAVLEIKLTLDNLAEGLNYAKLHLTSLQHGPSVI